MKKLITWFVGLFQSKPKVNTTVENGSESLGFQFDGETPNPVPVSPKRQGSTVTTPTRPYSSSKRDDDYERRKREEDQRRINDDQLIINTIMLNEMMDDSSRPEPEPYRHSNHSGVEQHTVTHSTPSYESHHTPSHDYGGSSSSDSGTTSTSDW